MDDMHDLDDLLPSPPTILWDNQYHVSEDVWDGGGRQELETFCGIKHMREWKLNRSQRELLYMVGFGIFANRHVVLQTDHSRISVLVERWRPETNTFFMKQGEMTITLEDVGYITGLPVFGEALTCGVIESRKKYFQDNWFEPLTDDEVKKALFRNKIKLSWLYDKYGTRKPTKGDMRAIAIHTKAYMLYVIGAVLFPCKSRSFVHPRYIQPLSNLRQIRNYAWGPAVLACLYRGLEFAAKKTSKSCGGCVWILEVWSYERFPLISRPIKAKDQDDYPVGEGWAYSTKQGGVGIKRRQGAPHHSLPLYRGEFDGIAGDTVEWLPYSRFDDVMDWEMIQFKLAGQARVSLVCYDIVEWQHPERVIRQFGCLPQIPCAPVSMLHYRQPKEATFSCEDWLSRWFVDIGRWARFCHQFEGLVDDVDGVSEEEYLAWYLDIARTRIRKPQVEVQPQWTSRELMPNPEAYLCLLKGLNMLKKLDARVPAEFMEEFSDIAQEYLSPCTCLMKKIKGPRYTPPVFQNIRQAQEDTVVHPSRSVGGILEHDIIDMTQPSQHIPQPPNVCVASSSRPQKLAPRKMSADKWDIKKSLRKKKMDQIDDDWG